MLVQTVCSTGSCASTDIHKIRQYNSFGIAMCKAASGRNKLCLRNALVCDLNINNNGSKKLGLG